MTLLANAVWYFRIDCMRFLIKKGANINTKDCEGFTPLMLAVLCKNIEGLKILIHSKANPLLRDIRGKTVLDIALKNKESLAAKLIRGRIAEVYELKKSKMVRGPYKKRKINKV